MAPDGTWLANVSADRNVRLWDVAIGRIQTVTRVERILEDLAWLSDSILALAARVVCTCLTS
jgi:WD40 repeat protein